MTKIEMLMYKQTGWVKISRPPICSSCSKCKKEVVPCGYRYFCTVSSCYVYHARQCEHFAPRIAEE